jgi:hypothetical protein
MISWSEGSFPVVNNVTGVTDYFNPNHSQAGEYDIQLNSNVFSPVYNCGINAWECQGWEQFIYSESTGQLFIEFWIFHYLQFYSACPSGWTTSGSDCFVNSAPITLPREPITSLGNLTLTAESYNGTDTVIMSTGDGNLYANSQSGLIGLSSDVWNLSEFNVFGDGSGSQARFNPGATIVVQTLTNNGSPAAPTCQLYGDTGETNNLSLVPNSCCAIGGANPGIQFTESNIPGLPAPPCPATVTTQPALMWWNKGTGTFEAWLLGSNGNVEGYRDLTWGCKPSSGCEFNPIVGMANNVLLYDTSSDSSSGELFPFSFDALGNPTLAPPLSWTCGPGCDSSWQLVGQTMENNQSGVLWYNAGTGQLSMWDLSGSTVTGSQGLTWTCGGSCAASWRPVLTTDINGDGNTDVLWYNESAGLVSVWLLNGATVTGNQNLTWTCSSPSGCASTWSIVGAADVNGDGHPDLSWFDESAGVISSWLLDGSGNVTGEQNLNWTCGADVGCAPAWLPIGFVSFP